MPAWALEGGTGATPPAPPPAPPPPLGLVFWVRGDLGLQTLVDPDLGLVVPAWLDQSGMGQDLSSPNLFRPSAGIDTIDDVPCVTFPNGDATQSQYMTRAGFSMLNRSSVPFSFAQPRTVMAMVLPKFSPGAFDITGGPVFCFGELPAFECLFDLETGFAPNALYAWSSGWRDPGAFGQANTALQGTPTPGGAGGIYNGVPTLTEHRSTGNPNIAFAVNGVDQTLTLASQYGATGATPNAGFFLGTPQAGVGLHFLGAFAEVIVWDYDLSTDPVAHAQARGYFARRYPSAPIVV